jgi:DNA-binding response OmpR family regulator
MATRGRLLLVEDDRSLAELITYHFEREGYARVAARGMARRP